MDIEIKYQACNLSNALCRNINDNFDSVSFEILNNGDIQIRIILSQRTEIEDEYIDDMITEFEALQQTDCVKMVETLVGVNFYPLKNVVYRSG